jgi:hypothetical protein
MSFFPTHRFAVFSRKQPFDIQEAQPGIELGGLRPMDHPDLILMMSIKLNNAARQTVLASAVR